MALTGTKGLDSTLSPDGARALAGKLEAFYGALTPQEQAHLEQALRRLADDSLDVDGHGIVEIGLIWQLMIILSTAI